jgi:hypothetical protein
MNNVIPDLQLRITRICSFAAKIFSKNEFLVDNAASWFNVRRKTG